MGERAPGDQQTYLSGPFAILLGDIERRLDRIDRSLHEIGRQYRGRSEDRSSRAFVEALQLAAQGMGELVRSRERNFLRAHLSADPDDLRAAVYEDLGGQALSIEREIEYYLPSLRVERPKELDVFIVPLMHLAKRIVPNVELLFLAWSSDGYETEPYDAEALERVDPSLAANLRRVFGEDVKFVKLWHPATRERDIFHHPVFAHELAHTAILEAVPAEKLEPDDRPGHGDVPPTFSTVASDGVKLPPGLHRDSDNDDYRRLLSWFVEVACDIVAMRTVGPAYAVAFADVTSHNRTLERKHSSGQHPPAAIRFRFLREELAAFGFGEGSGGFGDLLRRYTTAYPSTVGEKDRIPGAENWLEDTVDRFRHYLPLLLGDQEFEPKTLHSDLDLVVDLASQGVPPAERIVAVDSRRRDSARGDGEWSEPLDWRSILNGTLLWHLREHGVPAVEPLPDEATARQAALRRRRQRAEHRKHAAQLAAGGIELSEFHGRAQRLNAQLGGMRLPEGMDDWTRL